MGYAKNNINKYRFLLKYTGQMAMVFNLVIDRFKRVLYNIYK